MRIFVPVDVSVLLVVGNGVISVGGVEFSYTKSERADPRVSSYLPGWLQLTLLFIDD